MRNDDDNYDHNHIIKRPHPGKPEGIPSKKVPKFTIPSLSSFLISFLISYKPHFPCVIVMIRAQ